MDIVKEVISKIKPESSVILNNLGESLLHPQFFEIVEMFSDAKIRTMITTNACGLDQELVDKLVNSSISSIRISVDFISKETEDIIKPMIDDNRVIINIKGTNRKAINKFREKYGNNGCITFLVDFAGQMDFNGDFSPARNCIFLNENKCVVLWDGQICGCCYDYEGNNILGDISEIDILNHREYDLCENCNGLDLRMM